MPKVSIIIPCYNLGQYLDEAVDSVLSQTYQDFEIIIINDGSTDEFTNTLLKSYSRPKTTVYHTKNQGLPTTRNYGIERASGKYICCLDADDRYHPTFLEKTVRLMEEDHELTYGFVTTWVQVIGENNFIWKTSDYDVLELLNQNVIHVASLFRKKCWKDVKGYSTNLSGYQDWDFWISIISRNYIWGNIHEPLFYYRRRKGSMISESLSVSPTLIKRIAENNIKIYRNNLAALLEKKEYCFRNCINEKDLYFQLIQEKDKAIQEKDKAIQEKDNLLNPNNKIKRFLLRLILQKTSEEK